MDPDGVFIEVEPFAFASKSWLLPHTSLPSILVRSVKIQLERAPLFSFTI